MHAANETAPDTASLDLDFGFRPSLQYGVGFSGVTEKYFYLNAKAFLFELNDLKLLGIGAMVDARKPGFLISPFGFPVDKKTDVTFDFGPTVIGVSLNFNF